MDDATGCADSISLDSLVTTTEFPPPKVFCSLSLLSDCRTLSRLKPEIATSSSFFFLGGGYDLFFGAALSAVV